MREGCEKDARSTRSLTRVHACARQDSCQYVGLKQRYEGYKKYKPAVGAAPPLLPPEQPVTVSQGSESMRSIVGIPQLETLSSKP